MLASMTKAECSLSHNNDDKKSHSSNEAAFMPFAYLMAMGANDISKLVLSKPKRHWGEFITASRLGMIVAPRAAGKSTFTLALALSMVSHVEFLGYKSGGSRKVIILDGEMFGKLSQLLAFSRKEKNIIYGSFVISILYNIIGLSYAVQGNLSPIIAAILMPLSSISIVLYTFLMSRHFAQKINN